MTSLRLEPFDPKRDFVNLRDFLCRGKNLKKDDRFDRSTVPTRLLRLLFETRAIGYPEAEAGPTVRQPRIPTREPHEVDHKRRMMTSTEQQAMVDMNTKAGLLDIAEKEGVEIPNTRFITKAGIVEAIAKARYDGKGE